MPTILTIRNYICLMLVKRLGAIEAHITAAATFRVLPVLVSCLDEANGHKFLSEEQAGPVVSRWYPPSGSNIPQPSLAVTAAENALVKETRDKVIDACVRSSEGEEGSPAADSSSSSGPNMPLPSFAATAAENALTTEIRDKTMIDCPGYGNYRTKGRSIVMLTNYLTLETARELKMPDKEQTLYRYDVDIGTPGKKGRGRSIAMRTNYPTLETA